MLYKSMNFEYTRYANTIAINHAATMYKMVIFFLTASLPSVFFNAFQPQVGNRRYNQRKLLYYHIAWV